MLLIFRVLLLGALKLLYPVAKLLYLAQILNNNLAGAAILTNQPPRKRIKLMRSVQSKN